MYAYRVLKVVPNLLKAFVEQIPGHYTWVLKCTYPTQLNSLLHCTTYLRETVRRSGDFSCNKAQVVGKTSSKENIQFDCIVRPSYEHRRVCSHNFYNSRRALCGWDVESACAKSSLPLHSSTRIVHRLIRPKRPRFVKNIAPYAELVLQSQLRPECVTHDLQGTRRPTVRHP